MRFYDAIIFDFGRVLTAFEPDAIARKLIGDPNRALRVRRAIFTGQTWSDLDQGLLTEAQAEARIIADNPDEAGDIRRFFKHYKQFLSPLPAGVAILGRVRRAGYALYGLTNAGREAWEESLQRNGFLKLFDGVVVSSLERIAKPDPALYETLLDRYALAAERCIFIDDVPMNVETARRLGFDGIHFRNHRQLDAALTERGVFRTARGKTALQPLRLRLAAR